MKMTHDELVTAIKEIEKQVQAAEREAEKATRLAERLANKASRLDAILFAKYDEEVSGGKLRRVRLAPPDESGSQLITGWDEVPA